MFSINDLRGSVEFYLPPGEYHVHGFSHGPAPLFERLGDSAPLDLPADGEVDLEGGRYRIVVAEGHEADIEFEAL